MNLNYIPEADEDRGNTFCVKYEKNHLLVSDNEINEALRQFGTATPAVDKNV